MSYKDSTGNYKRNIQDRFRGWENDLIKLELLNNSMPYAVLMSQIHGDFNMGTMVRNANAFGMREAFYLSSGKHYDKRSTVGTHNYTYVNHLKTYEQVYELKKKYPIFIGVENNVPETVDLYSIKHWPKNSLFIFGEEGTGLTKEMMDMCDLFVEIRMRGSVRSLNVGTSSGIVMHYLSECYGK